MKQKRPMTPRERELQDELDRMSEEAEELEERLRKAEEEAARWARRIKVLEERIASACGVLHGAKKEGS